MRKAVCIGNKGLLYKISSVIKFRILNADYQNNRKAPASPHTTRAGVAYRDGAPGQSEARGGGGGSDQKVVVVNMNIWFEESKKHNLQVI